MFNKTMLALAALTLAGAAQAGTFNFTGSFDDAPATTVLSGSFSFDDTVVAAGGSDGAFALTALSFSFGGQVYTLALDPTAYVQFESGALVGPNASFTTPGGTLALQSFFGSSGFSHGDPVSGSLGTLTISAVPEPESYALMLAGLGVVGWLARRRKV